jgi:hypothetical protein
VGKDREGARLGWWQLKSAGQDLAAKVVKLDTLRTGHAAIFASQLDPRQQTHAPMQVEHAQLALRQAPPMAKPPTFPTADACLGIIDVAD